MRFEPKSLNELETMNLLPEGIYPYEVFDAEEKVSKSGNDMLSLKLRIYLQDKAYIVFDYLLESLAFKLIHFCEANGLMDKYDSGTLSPDDCLGKKGYAEIIIQPKSEIYRAQNKVSDYVTDMPKELSTPTEFKDDELSKDVDIPF